MKTDIVQFKKTIDQKLSQLNQTKLDDGETINYKAIGKRLKHLRDAENNRYNKDFKQQELAFILDISPQNYSKVESANIGIALKQLVRASIFFGITVESLLFGSNENQEIIVNPDSSNKDVVIASQQKTIETLEKHIKLLEKVNEHFVSS